MSGLRASLLDLSGDPLDLSGTKNVGNQGVRGACPVIVHGERIISCLPLAVRYAGSEITSVAEAVAYDATGNRVRDLPITSDKLL